MWIPIIVHEDKSVTNFGSYDNIDDAEKAIIEYAISVGRFVWMWDDLEEFAKEDMGVYENIPDFHERAKKCETEEDYHNEFREDFMENFHAMLEEVNTDYEKWHMIVL